MQNESAILIPGIKNLQTTVIIIIDVPNKHNFKPSDSVVLAYLRQICVVQNYFFSRMSESLVEFTVVA